MLRCSLLFHRGWCLALSLCLANTHLCLRVHLKCHLLKEDFPYLSCSPFQTFPAHTYTSTPGQYRCPCNTSSWNYLDQCQSSTPKHLCHKSKDYVKIGSYLHPWHLAKCESWWVLNKYLWKGQLGIIYNHSTYLWVFYVNLNGDMNGIINPTSFMLLMMSFNFSDSPMDSISFWILTL